MFGWLLISLITIKWLEECTCSIDLVFVDLSYTWRSPKLIEQVFVRYTGNTRNLMSSTKLTAWLINSSSLVVFATIDYFSRLLICLFFIINKLFNKKDKHWIKVKNYQNTPQSRQQEINVTNNLKPICSKGK